MSYESDCSNFTGSGKLSSTVKLFKKSNCDQQKLLQVERENLHVPLSLTPEGNPKLIKKVTLELLSCRLTYLILSSSARE